jgi:heptosyltransferase-3
MRASSCDIGAWDAEAVSPHRPKAPGSSLSLGWCLAFAAAGGICALGAPTSVFLVQAGIFTCLALALAHPRLALRPLARHPQLAAALAFYFLVQLASIVYSQHPLRSLICLRGDWPVLYLPILLAVLQIRRARRVAWVAVLLAASVAGLIGLIQNLTGTDPLGRAVLEADGSGRFHAIGTLRGHLTYGGVMLAGFVSAFALVLTTRGHRRRALIVVAAACGLGLVASYARTALLGALAGAAVAVAAALAASHGGRDQRRRILTPALLIVAGCVVLVAFTPGLRARIASLGDLGGDPRPRLWATALRIFADFPLFGAGLGAFKSHFPLYRLPGTYMATGHPHNDALNVLVHSGLAGLLAWGALWWTVLRAAFARDPGAAGPGRRSGTRPGSGGGAGTGGGAGWRDAAPGVRDPVPGVRDAAPGVLAAAVVAGFLVAGLAQCYFTDEEPATMLWLLLALAISERDATGSPSPQLPGPTANGRRPFWLARLERAGKRALLPLAALFFLPRDRRGPPPGPPDLSRARSILLIRQDNRLGNLVLITPLLQALREAAPDAHIGLVVGSRFADVLAGAPWVDELLLMHKHRLIQRPWTYPAHLASIRSRPWDIAIDLSNPDTHSFYSAFLPLVARAPWRVGFDHPLSRPALNAVVAPPELECHYSLAPLLLLSALGADPRPRPMRLSPALLERVGAHPAGASRMPGGATSRTPGGAIVVHPGGRGAKQWPSEAFTKLARSLAARGVQPLLVIGSRGEQAQMSRLEHELPGVEVRAIADLEGLVAALAGARLYIGCDAGPLHVAAALGVPALALFLSSHPLRYAPLGEQHTTVVLGEGSHAWVEDAQGRSTVQPIAAGEAPEAGGPRLLAPDRNLVKTLAERRPNLVAAPEGLDLAAQAGFVLARAERMLAGSHSPLESDGANAEDHLPVGTGGVGRAATAAASGTPDRAAAGPGQEPKEHDRT